MGMPKPNHLGGRVAIMLFHQRSESLPGCYDRPEHAHLVRLEIDNYGEILQPVINFHQAQRFGVDIFTNIPQRFHIHQQLVDRFHPDPKMALPNLALLGWWLWHSLPLRRGRPGMPFPRAMPGIGFEHNRESFPCPG